MNPAGWRGDTESRSNVRVGLEIDFSPRHADRCIETVNTFDLDVVGSRVHFLDGEDVVSRRSALGWGEISAADVYPKYLGVM